MSTVVTYVGNQYNVPAYQDTGYAQGSGNLSSYLIALATGSLTLSGGSFPLTADVDFGGSFGLKSIYYKSRAASPATTGVIRLGSAEVIAWRNNGGGGNLPLTTNATDQLLYNGNQLVDVAGNFSIAGSWTFSGNTPVLSALTAKSFIYSDANQRISSTAAPTNGQLLIGSTGNVPVVAALTGTANQVIVTNAAGTITLSTPQSIGTGSTPTFAGVNAGSAKITALANGTASTDAAAFGQLKVIQVVTTTTTTAATTTSATFGASNLSLAITPTSASNRVMIIASGCLRSSAIATDSAYATIFRAGSNILGANGGAFISSNAVMNINVPITLSYVDSPATTSATTYAVAIRSDGGGSTVTFGGTNLTQSITLMEVV